MRSGMNANIKRVALAMVLRWSQVGGDIFDCGEPRDPNFDLTRVKVEGTIDFLLLARCAVNASHLYGDDDTGHVWDGPTVVIHSAELHTCSRCGCDPSDDAASLLCEPGERDNAET